MLARHHDPIAAIATAPGRGAVGIVRVSGHGLAPFVQALLGRALRPREAHYLPFPDAQGQPIDRGLALFFPAPHSYTGEDVLELQAHGGPVVLQLLLARCLEAAASRAVQLRALNGRTVRNLLKQGLDQQPLPKPATPAAQPSSHENVRGADYYTQEELFDDDPTHPEPIAPTAGAASTCARKKYSVLA